MENKKTILKNMIAPFKKVVGAVKGGVTKYKKFAEEQRALDKEAYNEQKELRGGPVSSNEQNVSEFLNIRKKIKEQRKQKGNY